MEKINKKINQERDLNKPMQYYLRESDIKSQNNKLIK